MFCLQVVIKRHSPKTDNNLEKYRLYKEILHLRQRYRPRQASGHEFKLLIYVTLLTINQKLDLKLFILADRSK